MVVRGFQLYGRWSWRALAVSIMLTGCTTWCGQQSASTSPGVFDDYVKNLELDRELLDFHLSFFTAEPHPFGSERQAEIAEYIDDQLDALGYSAQKIRFSAPTPNPVLMENPSAPADVTVTKSGTNIFLRLGLVKDAPCVVLIGSHYDTKHLGEIEYVGANDSASSSALLLNLAAYLKGNELPADLTCDIAFIWFDGEEPVLQNWRDGELKHPANIQDNTYGSRSFASSLRSCKKAEAYCLPDSTTDQWIDAVIIVDMIGSPDLKFTNDSHSDSTLKRDFRRGLKTLGEEKRWVSYLQPVEDDHTPFLKLGIPAMDIIDFHNLQYWHADGDEVANLSRESIEIAGKSLFFLGLERAAKPQVFL